MARKVRICVDGTELLLAGVFALTLAWYSSHHVSEPEWHETFEARFGPKESQFAEEWLVRDFFGDRKSGFFVDVGAGDARKWSTTYRLEETLSWSGIAIEPQPQYAEGFARLRPKTTLIQAFVADQPGQMQTLWVPEADPALATFDRRYLDSLGLKSSAMNVPTVTLTEVLDAKGLNRIDFLSLDIELAEPLALQGFEIGRFRPALVCVEAHDVNRQWLIDYFHRAGYVLVGRYLQYDWLNLYFTPYVIKPARSLDSALRSDWTGVSGQVLTRAPATRP